MNLIQKFNLGDKVYTDYQGGIQYGEVVGVYEEKDLNQSLYNNNFWYKLQLLPRDDLDIIWKFEHVGNKGREWYERELFINKVIEEWIPQSHVYESMEQLINKLDFRKTINDVIQKSSLKSIANNL